jgi:hypothetical protein
MKIGANSTNVIFGSPMSFQLNGDDQLMLNNMLVTVESLGNAPQSLMLLPDSSSMLLSSSSMSSSSSISTVTATKTAVNNIKKRQAVLISGFSMASNGSLRFTSGGKLVTFSSAQAVLAFQMELLETAL